MKENGYSDFWNFTRTSTQKGILNLHTVIHISPTLTACPLHTHTCAHTHAHPQARVHTHTHTQNPEINLVCPYKQHAHHPTFKNCTESSSSVTWTYSGTQPMASSTAINKVILCGYPSYTYAYLITLSHMHSL